jgi:hypothetical protein
MTLQIDDAVAFGRQIFDGRRIFNLPPLSFSVNQTPRLCNETAYESPLFESHFWQHLSLCFIGERDCLFQIRREWWKDESTRGANFGVFSSAKADPGQIGAK